MTDLHVLLVGRVCPECGSAAFTIQAGELNYNVRLCSNCGARYVLPTPRWHGAVAILIGLVSAASAVTLIVFGRDPVQSLWHELRWMAPLLTLLTLISVAFLGIGLVMLLTDEAEQARQAKQLASMTADRRVIRLSKVESSPVAGNWRRYIASSNYGAFNIVLPFLGYVVWGVILIPAFAGLSLLNQVMRGDLGQVWIAAVCLLGGLAVLMERFSRRLRAVPRSAIRMSQLKAPVILLRAFADDQMRIKNVEPSRPWYGVLTMPESRTFEEVLAAIFSGHGPVIAVRRPAEVLPPLGGLRLWLDAEHWEEAVDEILVEARLVVLIMGAPQKSPGLAKEVEKVFSMCEPEKLVIVVPPVPHSLAAEIWKQVELLSHGRLPEYTEGAIAVGFSRDWSPTVVHARGDLTDASYESAFQFDT
ncbi:MAG: hypothetical protein K1X74_00935 [Pirellulales bacterium]|nr:hypothetical protein [Pirellulales bacterium]